MMQTWLKWELIKSVKLAGFSLMLSFTWLVNFLKKNGPTPASFSFIFGLFKQTLQFLQWINVKNIHLVYGTGNRTHDLWNMSLFP